MVWNARKCDFVPFAEVSHTLVIYVPPHDLLAVLNDAASVMGQDRKCVVARELTKVAQMDGFVRNLLQ